MKLQNLAFNFLLTACFFFIFAGCSRPSLQEQADGWHAQMDPTCHGVSIGQIMKGKKVFANAGVCGKDLPPVDENTMYELGSVTKVFTATLLAEAVVLEKVKLEDTVDQYLPAGVLDEDSQVKSITLLELATHNSGLARDPDGLMEHMDVESRNPFGSITQEELFAYLGGLTDEDFLGRGRYDYSNTGYALLGIVLETVYQKDYASVLSERILEPLGMESTWVSMTDTKVSETTKSRLAVGHVRSEAKPYWKQAAYVSAGGMVSTVSDLLRFAEAHWAENTPESLKKAFELATEPKAGFVGLAWHYQRGCCYHRGGTGGFTSEIWVSAEGKYARVQLRNTIDYGPERRKGDFTEILGFWEEATQPDGEKMDVFFKISDDGSVYQYFIEDGVTMVPNWVGSFEGNQLIASYYENHSEYRAALEDGILQGTLYREGEKLPLNMTHSENLPVALGEVWDLHYQGDLASLQGFWSGKIGGRKGFLAYLEIAPFGDRFEVKLWNPEGNPLPFGVSKVEYNLNGEQRLRVEVYAFKAFFVGIVDLESKSITGIWSRSKVPVTLHWSAERPQRAD